MVNSSAAVRAAGSLKPRSNLSWSILIQWCLWNGLPAAAAPLDVTIWWRLLAGIGSCRRNQLKSCFRKKVWSKSIR